MSTNWATRGSQLWLQVAVNLAPEALNRQLRHAVGVSADAPVHWASPLLRDGFREYRDQPALDLLDIRTDARALSTFWPARGPVWDGLATVDDQVVLLEAKAHVAEMVSPASKASTASLDRIRTSLDQVKTDIAPHSTADWCDTFYQYANRIAHLHLLRVQNAAPAHLVFLYFVNALDVGGPRSKEHWESAIETAECYLGLRHHRLAPYVHHLFLDVAELRTRAHGVGRPIAALRAGGLHSREQTTARALNQLGHQRFVTFLMAARVQGRPYAIDHIVEDLERGQSVEQVFYTGEANGYSLSATKVRGDSFAIRFGYQTSDLCGDGGEWEVDFDSSGAVASIRSGLQWIS